MINEEEERLFKQVDRIQMARVVQFLKLKVQNKINKLVKATPETLTGFQGEIKGLNEVIKEAQHIMNPTKVKLK